MADANIRLETFEDGGNPSKQGQIHQIDKDSFSVTPFSEDNDPNYKFRLEVHAKKIAASLESYFCRSTGTNRFITNTGIRFTESVKAMEIGTRFF